MNLGLALAVVELDHAVGREVARVQLEDDAGDVGRMGGHVHRVGEAVVDQGRDGGAGAGPGEGRVVTHLRRGGSSVGLGQGHGQVQGRGTGRGRAGEGAGQRQQGLWLGLWGCNFPQPF